MDPMKKEKKEKAFFNKYMGILDKIEDGCVIATKKQSLLTTPPSFGGSTNPT